MIKSGLLLSVMVIVFGLSVSAQAKVSAKEATKLGTSLTPLGGDRSANADGSIPEWRGGIQFPPEGYKKPGQHHVNPFPDDKPLFVVTSKNIGKYEKFLTDGQKALFKTYPDTFKMPIYQTRRTAANPQWVYDNTYKNATKAELVQDGNGIKHAIGGIPFPIPKNSLEVMWNHITRYRGEYLVREGSEVAVQENGSYTLITTKAEVLFDYYKRGITAEELDNNFLYYLSITKAPARLAGGAVLSHEYLNQNKNPRRAWGYNSGQRRVRKSPSLEFDTPIAAADGLRTVDDTDMFNGSPERYTWKLIGKTEKYIPYNNYLISTPEVPASKLLLPGHINPDYARYEKHRVWVVEATLRSGKRHIYHKRRFYIDEDSWTIAIADQYDERGQLWRVSMMYLKNYYELPAIFTCMDVYHDVLARRYHIQGMFSEEEETIDFSKVSPGSRYFSPQELRRRGR